MPNNLKPCPLCGGECKKRPCSVSCYDCEYELHADTVEKATVLHNTRPREAELEAERDDAVAACVVMRDLINDCMTLLLDSVNAYGDNGNWISFHRQLVTRVHALEALKGWHEICWQKGIDPLARFDATTDAPKYVWCNYDWGKQLFDQNGKEIARLTHTKREDGTPIVVVCCNGGESTYNTMDKAVELIKNMYGIRDQSVLAAPTDAPKEGGK